jgi:hypothetical protein
MVRLDSGVVFLMTPEGPLNLSSLSGRGWSVKGEPPRVTVEPELEFGEWRGSLSAGWLEGH